MSRALQPTILYINQCERLFWKKVPKDQTDIKPRLLGKYIIKQIVKPIKKEDKVLVLGISNEPFKAKLGKMKKCFERIIIVPRADYGTTFQIHRVLAMKKYGLPRDFDFSAVSMVTKGYASSVVYNNLNATLGIERRMKFPIKPLKAQELIEGYFNREEPKFPITDDVSYDYQTPTLSQNRPPFHFTQCSKIPVPLYFTFKTFSLFYLKKHKKILDRDAGSGCW